MKIDFWELALAQARQAQGFVSPNPAVGAVIVRSGKIVGQGHTQPPGQGHAEIQALKQAGNKARGATLYTTLEPCSHTHKSTGPCTAAIIEAKIAQVFVAVKDPNPAVNGQGIKQLKKAGIVVELLAPKSLVATEAQAINQAFFKAIKTGLPYVTLKAGITLDGKIATQSGESQWITSPEARVDARLERSLCDAVLVGVGTVKADNPELAPHGQFKNKKLLRVIIDPELLLTKNYQVFRDKNVVVVHSGKASVARQEYFRKNNISTFLAGKKMVEWPVLLKYLGTQKIRSLYVEGGAGVHGSLCDAAQTNPQILDRILLYIAPKIFGGAAVSVIGGQGVSVLNKALVLQTSTIASVGVDYKLTGIFNQY